MFGFFRRSKPTAIVPIKVVNAEFSNVTSDKPTRPAAVYCVDCKHGAIPRHGAKEYTRCGHPIIMMRNGESLASGYATMFCSFERSNSNMSTHHCGPQGKLWEPR